MRKRAILIISGLLLLTVSALAGYQINKKDFQASEDFATAEISLNITQNDQVANGVTMIAGDCPEKELPGSDGRYYCQLVSGQAGTDYVTIDSLTFFNFADDTVTPIRVSAAPTTESNPFLLSANEKLVLEVVITNGEAVVTRWNTATQQAEPFPLPDPED